MVIGRHSEGPVLARADAVSAAQRVQFAMSEGTADARGPGGVGRTDALVLAPTGWDARYGVFSLQAAQGRLKATLAAPGGLTHPIVRVGAIAAPSEIWIEGRRRELGREVLLSYDAANRELWLTLLGRFEGELELELR